jgi:hypothetical protein
LNLHFGGTRLYRPLGYLIAQLALGAINRDRTGAYRITTWRADRYTMTAVPDEGVEPPLSLCRSDALPLRQPGWKLAWYPRQDSNLLRQIRSLA